MLHRGSFLLIAASSVLTADKLCPARNLAAMSAPQPVRFAAVAGHDGRANDVIYCARRDEHPLRRRIVFFGGDTQDYPEAMQAHRDNRRFVKWNLLNTAVILRDRFPDADVFVVRPKRMHLKTFGCYDNFVSGNDFGVPDHETSDRGALRHLRSLLANALTSVDEGKNDGADRTSLVDDAPVVLVGFSKGCVVLNQILHELHLTQTDDELGEFVKRIGAMYWLDGGHSGGSNLWITKYDILKRLANTGIELRVYMTPYQLYDERRPWLREEVKKFVNTLQRLRANVVYTELFTDGFEFDEHNIEMHFRVLENIGS